MAVSDTTGFIERDRTVSAARVAGAVSRQAARVRQALRLDALQPNNDWFAGPHFVELEPGLAKESGRRA